eukprot:4391855-Prymnesium_polylepis.1
MCSTRTARTAHAWRCARGRRPSAAKTHAKPQEGAASAASATAKPQESAASASAARRSAQTMPSDAAAGPRRPYPAWLVGSQVERRRWDDPDVAEFFRRGRPVVLTGLPLTK